MQVALDHVASGFIEKAVTRMGSYAVHRPCLSKTTRDIVPIATDGDSVICGLDSTLGLCIVDLLIIELSVLVFCWILSVNVILGGRFG